MKTILKFAAVVLVATLAACGGAQQEESLYDKFFPNKEGEFRGHYLNDSKEEVLKTEGENGLIKDGEDYLDYDRELDPNGDLAYGMNFEFDEKGLYEMGMDIYIYNDANEEEAIKKGGKLFEEIAADFNKKFGEPIETEKGKYYKWEFKAKNGGNLSEASIQNFSEEDRYGSISITIAALE